MGLKQYDQTWYIFNQVRFNVLGQPPPASNICNTGNRRRLQPKISRFCKEFEYTDMLDSKMPKTDGFHMMSQKPTVKATSLAFCCVLIY